MMMSSCYPASTRSIPSTSSATCCDCDDRDVVDNLLRSCGLERQSERQRWVLHRFKFNRYNQVTEAMFGRTIRGRGTVIAPTQQNNNPTLVVTAGAGAAGVTTRPQTSYWMFADHRHIGKLSKMKKLHLSHFDALHTLQILNQVADDLPDLECLMLDQCQFLSRIADRGTDDGANKYQVDKQLKPPSSLRIFPKLKKLMIKKPFGIRLQDDVKVDDMKQFMMFVIQTMPHLEELHCSFVPYTSTIQKELSNPIDAILDVMIDDASSSSSQSSMFCTNLKVFTWNHSGMTDRGLRRLVVDAFPLYRNLQSVSLQNNKISSLLGLVEEELGKGHVDGDNNNNNISSLPTVPFSLSVRSFNLQHNQVMKKLHNGNKFRTEVMALLYLLQKRLPFCGSLSAPWDDWEHCIEHELRVNRSGGRVLLRRRNNTQRKDSLVLPKKHKDAKEEQFPKPQTTRTEDGKDNDNDRETSSLSTPSPPPPPSLFPFIFHRSYSHLSSGHGFLPAVNHPNHPTALSFLVRSFVPDLLTQQQQQHDQGQIQHN
mmetsp:Transcript_43632/g.105801  ORF Transcript_43632/g.105801 Transcript_43632/m.105801 type:complete len:539 (-) Transcript_43632:36-1652(-)